ncbi:MAG: hypothetical protein AAB320_10350 [Elusimicrobiota bacterium]
MLEATPRLLLVEFFRGALRRNERSMLFPFLKGLADQRGFPTLWLCYGGDVSHLQGAQAGRTLYASMPPEDLRSLSRHLKRLRPTHVVTSDVLSPEALALLAACRPAPKHLVMPLPGDLPAAGPGQAWRGEAAHCGWFLDWLGVEDPALAGRYLIEAVVPGYKAVLANKEARAAQPQITIAGGVLCANRRTVAKNPHFSGVDLAGLDHRGCSFCPCATRAPLTGPRTRALPLIAAQFRQILKTAGRGGRDKNRYEFFDIRSFWKFDEVFALILRLGLPPSVFLFNPRLDDVLRLRDRIERTLPALAEAGHEVRMLSMGAENFSERENTRFNKGISLDQVDEFLALTKRWGEAYPGVFKPYKAGHPVVEIGFILFTPWTTLEDLRLNLTRAAERGFPGRGYWLYSILLLEPATPIFRLAEKEGVIVESFPDRGQVYGLFKNEGELEDVHAWRFKDPKVADFFAMHVRVCAADREGPDCAFFEGDAAYGRTLSLYREANQGAAVTPLAIAFALLELLEAAQGPYDREDLSKEAIRSATVRLAQPQAEARAPAPELSVEAEAVEGVLARLRGKNAGLFPGVLFAPVEEVQISNSRRIRLKMTAASRELVVDLLGAGSKQPCFLTSRHFRAVYHQDAPAPSPAERQQLSQLLRLIDAGVDEAYKTCA